MTPAQKEVYQAIEYLTKKLGYPPSVREIAAATNRKPTTTQQKLHALKAAGRVEWEDGRARTIRIVKHREG